MSTSIRASQSELQIPSTAAAERAPSPQAAASPRRPLSPNPQAKTGIVVFSGGSAANNLVDVFEHVREANKCTLSYVIPISDNGGSTSEIIRVFGGPGTYALSKLESETDLV